MAAGDAIRAHAGQFRAAPGNLRPLVVAATVKATMDTAATARELAPVDTGYLRSSITIETGMDGATIYGEATAGANYARWVENGTPSGSHAPQPFMGPAREANAPKWRAAMAQLGGKAIQ